MDVQASNFLPAKAKAAAGQLSMSSVSCLLLVKSVLKLTPCFGAFASGLT
jgi:hypothetical protein